MPLFQTSPRRAKTAKVIMAVILRKEYLIDGQYLILLGSISIPSTDQNLQREQNPQPQKHQMRKSNVIQQHRSKGSLKDVILLPDPKVSNVPKGVAREELFVRGFTTTFELSTFMSEEEIRTILEAKSKDKLGESWGPKFTFVRQLVTKLFPQTSVKQNAMMVR